MSLTYSGSLYTLGARSKAVSQPAALKVLVAGARKIVGLAEPRWPVRTGLSRDSLHVTVAAREVSISAIGYAPFIVSRGVHPWDQYIVTPFEQFVIYEAPAAVGQALIRSLQQTAKTAGPTIGVRLG